MATEKETEVAKSTINTETFIGRFRLAQELEPAILSNNGTRKNTIRRDVKNHVPINGNDCCFVCAEENRESINKHHLLPVTAYSHRNDINEHLVTLCFNCHQIIHPLIYDKNPQETDGIIDYESFLEFISRENIRPKTKSNLIERGHWQKFVELDRIAARALLSV